MSGHMSIDVCLLDLAITRLWRGNEEISSYSCKKRQENLYLWAT